MRQYALEERDFLDENYPKLRAKEIAQKLGRTENAIRMQAWLMGLKKPSRGRRENIYRIPVKNGRSLRRSEILTGRGTKTETYSENTN